MNSLGGRGVDLHSFPSKFKRGIDGSRWITLEPLLWGFVEFKKKSMPSRLFVGLMAIIKRSRKERSFFFFFFFLFLFFFFLE